MKVLKKGRRQKGWSQKFICTGDGNGGGGCGATLLVEQDDLYVKQSLAPCVTFACIDCEVETSFEDCTAPNRNRLPSR